jgi:hypothetical protein
MKHEDIEFENHYFDPYAIADTITVRSNENEYIVEVDASNNNN